jgi:hypothetical protein
MDLERVGKFSSGAVCLVLSSAVFDEAISAIIKILNYLKPMSQNQS